MKAVSQQFWQQLNHSGQIGYVEAELGLKYRNLPLLDHHISHLFIHSFICSYYLFIYKNFIEEEKQPQANHNAKELDHLIRLYP